MRRHVLLVACAIGVLSPVAAIGQPLPYNVTTTVSIDQAQDSDPVLDVMARKLADAGYPWQPVEDARNTAVQFVGRFDQMRVFRKDTTGLDRTIVPEGRATTRLSICNLSPDKVGTAVLVPGGVVTIGPQSCKEFSVGVTTASTGGRESWLGMALYTR